MENLKLQMGQTLSQIIITRYIHYISVNTVVETD